MIHGLCNQRRGSNVRVAAVIPSMSYVRARTERRPTPAPVVRPPARRQSVSLSFLPPHAQRGEGEGGGRNATAFLENVAA